jgi:hypothetical protein
MPAIEGCDRLGENRSLEPEMMIVLEEALMRLNSDRNGGASIRKSCTE